MQSLTHCIAQKRKSVVPETGSRCRAFCLQGLSDSPLRCNLFYY